jgi:hypothetical protein
MTDWSLLVAFCFVIVDLLKVWCFFRSGPLRNQTDFLSVRVYLFAETTSEKEVFLENNDLRPQTSDVFDNGEGDFRPPDF